MKTIICIILLLLPAAAFCAGSIASGLLGSALSGKAFAPKRDASYEVTEGAARVNRCIHNTGMPIRLGDREFQRGIGAHANGALTFTFREPIVSFACSYGIDGQMTGSPASVRGHVTADGKEVFTSPVMKGDGSFFDLEMTLADAHTLELRVDDAGDGITSDQWDWAEARCTGRSGKVYWLDELMSSAEYGARLPFCFTYGGRSSDELLPGWEKTVADKRVSASESRKTVTFTDPETGLQAVFDARIYEDCDSLDWTVYFTNTGTQNTPVISDISALALDVTSPGEAPLIKSSLPAELPKNSAIPYDEEARSFPGSMLLLKTKGSIGYREFCWDEFKMLPEYLQPGKAVRIGSVGSMPCGGEYSPYFGLGLPGGGLVCGIGWTGSWKASFDRNGDTLALRAGRDRVNTYLKPGETLRSARILISLYDGPDVQAGYDSFRKCMINHIIPRENGEPAFIKLCCASCAKDTNAATEALDISYVRAFRGLGFECTWFDAWYLKDGFPACMGNYRLPAKDIADPVRYPHGMKPVTRLVRESGMKTLLWLAPETVQPGTYIAEEHPEFDMEGSFALVDPEGYKYMLEVMTGIFREWGVDIWRTDSMTDYGRVARFLGETAPDREGIAEDVFCTTLYRFWDELVQNNPGLLIDNCAGGGTRLDLELISRSLPYWRSDSYCHIGLNTLKYARLNQLITCNLNFYIPWSIGACMAKTPYDMRSGYNTGLDFVDDPRSPDYPREELKKALEECKRLRKYHPGNFYVLMRPDTGTDSVCAWQYSRPEEEDGYAVVFRREDCPFCGVELAFRDIDDDADYEISLYETYDLQEKKTVKGSELKRFTALIREKPGSLLIEYKRIK